VASLGRLDQPNIELNSMIAGLQRVTGQIPTALAARFVAAGFKMCGGCNQDGRQIA